MRAFSMSFLFSSKQSHVRSALKASNPETLIPGTGWTDYAEESSDDSPDNVDPPTSIIAPPQSEQEYFNPPTDQKRPQSWIGDQNIQSISSPPSAASSTFSLFSALHLKPKFDQTVSENLFGCGLGKTKISILTLNIFIRPPGISNNSNDFKDERLEYLVKVWNKYDIVCLQEMFSFGSDRLDQLLENAVKSGFLYSSTSDKTSIFKAQIIDSGLLILSKYPILYQESKILSRGSGIDGICAKSVLFSRIHIHTNPDFFIDVFTTHLQASYEGALAKIEGGNSEGVRAKQVSDLVSFIQKCCSKYGVSNKKPTLLPPSTFEYKPSQTSHYIINTDNVDVKSSLFSKDPKFVPFWPILLVGDMNINSLPKLACQQVQKLVHQSDLQFENKKSNNKTVLQNGTTHVHHSSSESVESSPSTSLFSQNDSLQESEPIRLVSSISSPGTPPGTPEPTSLLSPLIPPSPPATPLLFIPNPETSSYNYLNFLFNLERLSDFHVHDVFFQKYGFHAPTFGDVLKNKSISTNEPEEPKIISLEEKKIDHPAGVQSILVSPRESILTHESELIRPKCLDYILFLQPKAGYPSTNHTHPQHSNEHKSRVKSFSPTILESVFDRDVNSAFIQPFFIPQPHHCTQISDHYGLSCDFIYQPKYVPNPNVSKTPIQPVIITVPEDLSVEPTESV